MQGAGVKAHHVISVELNVKICFPLGRRVTHSGQTSSNVWSMKSTRVWRSVSWNFNQRNRGYSHRAELRRMSTALVPRRLTSWRNDVCLVGWPGGGGLEVVSWTLWACGRTGHQPVGRVLGRKPLTARKQLDGQAKQALVSLGSKLLAEPNKGQRVILPRRRIFLYNLDYLE